VKEEVMKLVCCVFLLLVACGCCPGQSTSGNWSFAAPSSSGSQPRFSVEGPAFPDTSARGPKYQTVSPQATSEPSPRYAFPVRPLRFGWEARAGAIPGPLHNAGVAQLTLVYRDQTIDAASACHVEGKMLHYIDSLNSPRTIPIKRVNWKLTEAANSIKAGTLIGSLER
jgi:hypothetical protein